MSDLINEVLEYFPRKISRLLVDKIKYIEEIRIRRASKIVLKLQSGIEILDYIITDQEIMDCMQRICEYSIYSYQNQIAQGFITVKGGHRVGITGECVIENNKVINIRFVSSFNFRISKQIIGAATDVFKEIVENNNIKNTIIVSPPGYGKTTILKDLIRKLSTPSSEFVGKTVGVVDERGEISGIYRGQIQNDLGLMVDVINNVSKAVGIKMLVRSMAPEIVVADEIGNYDDTQAINYAFCSGVNGIFTAHGSSYEELKKNPIMKNIFDLNVIERLIFLDKQKGKIKEVKRIGERYDSNKVNG